MVTEVKVLVLNCHQNFLFKALNVALCLSQLRNNIIEKHIGAILLLILLILKILKKLAY